jgi:hypothetical protein
MRNKWKHNGGTIELGDGTRYAVEQHRNGAETLYRDPQKIGGRERKHNRKNARRRLRGNNAR